MKKLFLIVILTGFLALPAFAHRLDEYLQATIFSFQLDAVHATLRMVPGVSVAPGVIAAIDRNRDGTLSSGEEQQYADQVLGDLRLTEDGRRLPLQLQSVSFPSIEQMKAGTGEIQLAFSALLPDTRGEHVLAFENHNQEKISVYLVNSLVPDDPHLQLGAQTRSKNQSSYSVTFGQIGTSPSRTPVLSGFAGAFHLGVRHIAEGTDHLLFLLTLLLPAPLLAIGGRWAHQTTVRQSLIHILRIVTAFTLGHSVTLALSVFGIVRLPSRPVELLIAVSILVSAVHAFRPAFPGREALIAASFGLIHGLAFASALNELGVTGWYRVVSLLGFNLGVETMQIAVVAMALPPLLLLSRTPLYSAFRPMGAVFACIASSAWIFERVTYRDTTIGICIQALALHGVILSCFLWLISIVAWFLRRRTNPNAVLLVMRADRSS